MNRSNLAEVLLVAILAVFLLAAGCSGKEFNSGKNSDYSEENHNQKSFSVWLAYWDTDNLLQNFEPLKDKIDNVCYFSAYFDDKGKLFIPQGTTKAWELIKGTYGDKKYTSYLTIVNDVKKPDGSSSLKDTKILYNLFSSKESIKGHISEILTLALEGGYDGIEVDYEAIKKDMKLWKMYLQFLEELNRSARDRDIPLRVLLEPGTPVNELAFPQGPDYVMMCYNLHGYGTKPGPKADKEFLLRMVEKMKDVPGEGNFALANGGFDFAEDGTIAQLTEEKAVGLSLKHNSVPVRDEESGSLVFSYKDDKGLSHEVWYADDETINYWSSIIEEAGGSSFSLWRL